MKNKIILAVALLLAASLFSLAQERVYTEASDLTMVGKLIDTPNPYHRVDTVAYDEFNKAENRLVRQASGLAVAFKTNSKAITVVTEYGAYGSSLNTGAYASSGYDLYIKKDGKWLWAAAGSVASDKMTSELRLISGMADGEKECLLYLPLFSELYSVRIGTDAGSKIEPLANPFRHRVGIFGSSFTHGASCSRSGMTYPAQFSRVTGIQLLSLGVSGNSTLQQSFAKVLADADVDALIFDGFSNPSASVIEKRLFPFIETIQAAHPGVPLIFQRTIRRETRNFVPERERFEAEKIAMSDSLMRIACKRYKDVYYIYPDATAPSHDTFVDGVHPSDHGYTLWAESIREPVLKILRKYGIK